jgi:hypothetical protein
MTGAIKALPHEPAATATAPTSRAASVARSAKGHRVGDARLPQATTVSGFAADA